MKQYYYIQFRSPKLYREDVKIIVKDLKELKQWIKNDIENIKYEVKDFPKVGKRMYINNMHHDKAGDKIIGKVFTFGDRYREKDYIEYWCDRIPKNELYQFAGFEEARIRNEM